MSVNVSEEKPFTLATSVLAVVIYVKTTPLFKIAQHINTVCSKNKM